MSELIEMTIKGLLIPLGKSFTINYRQLPSGDPDVQRPWQYDVSIDGRAAPGTCDSPNLLKTIVQTWLWYVETHEDESEG